MSLMVSSRALASAVSYSRLAASVVVGPLRYSATCRALSSSPKALRSPLRPPSIILTTTTHMSALVARARHVFAFVLPPSLNLFTIGTSEKGVGLRAIACGNERTLCRSEDAADERTERARTELTSTFALRALPPSRGESSTPLRSRSRGSPVPAPDVSQNTMQGFASSFDNDRAGSLLFGWV